MRKAKKRGRPSKINILVVNSICQAVETEMIPIKIICSRLGVAYDTFRAWESAARTAIDKTDSVRSEHERLCCELMGRLDAIHRKHQKTLIDTIQKTDHARTARLVLSLSAEWDFIESFGGV